MINIKTITITNNGTVIRPYKKGQCKVIEKLTSIYDKVYHKRNPITGFILDDQNETVFVTHQFGESFLQELFPGYDIIRMDEIRPVRINSAFSLIPEITPTEIQYSILSQIQEVLYKKEWRIHLQTGYGKTMLAVYLSSILQMKTLVLCYNTDILKQWVSTYEDKTTINPMEIVYLNSSATLKKILDDKFNYHIFNVFICTPKLLISFATRYGFYALNTVLSRIGIGLKIFDEAHRDKSNVVKVNALTNVRHTLYLSADFSQASHEVDPLYQRIFYKVPLFKPSDEYAVTMKYTKAIIIEYDSKPTEIEKGSVFTSYGFSSQQYMVYQMEKGYIQNIIFFIIDTITKNDGLMNHKALFLFRNIEHVDIIYDLISTQYGNQYSIGKYHGKVDEEHKRYTLKESSIIISTYSSMGTGMDVADIKYVIALNQSNMVEDNQAAGRARPLKDGSDAVYFIVVDKGFSYNIKKLRSRLQYLKETKIKDIFKIKYKGERLVEK